MQLHVLGFIVKQKIYSLREVFLMLMLYFAVIESGVEKVVAYSDYTCILFRLK